MKKRVEMFLLFCGIAFGLAAFPVGGQVKEVVINQKPLVDFAAGASSKLRNGEIDFNQSFTVEFEGAVTKDGKLDPGKTKFVKTFGEEKIIAIVKDGILAVGETGWLAYLNRLGIEQIKATVSQDNELFAVVIASKQPTPERAKTVGAGLSGIISMAFLADKNRYKILGADEKKLLSGLKVTTEEKNVKINFSISKVELREMVERRLRESEIKTNG